MRRPARTAATLATVLFAGSVTTFAAGCGSSDATSPQQQVAGRYTLRTVNGRSLPYVYDQDADGKYEIVSETLTLRSDGTLAAETSERTTLPSGAVSTVNSTAQGTWTLSGTAVTLAVTDQDVVTGTTSGGNTITIGEGGYNAVYQK